jgi:hypothetical protein
MYTNLYVYKAPRLFMSGKLYWRYKKDETWTWRPVVIDGEFKEFHRVMESLGLTLWDIETMRKEEEE